MDQRFLRAVTDEECGRHLNDDAGPLLPSINGQWFRNFLHASHDHGEQDSVLQLTKRGRRCFPGPLSRWLGLPTGSSMSFAPVSKHLQRAMSSEKGRSLANKQSGLVIVFGGYSRRGERAPHFGEWGKARWRMGWGKKSLRRLRHNLIGGCI